MSAALAVVRRSTTAVVVAGSVAGGDVLVTVRGCVACGGVVRPLGIGGTDSVVVDCLWPRCVA